MGSQDELLEHAQTFAAVQARAAELLHVDVAGIERVEVGERPDVAAYGFLALPHAVAPLGIEVAEPAHLEGEERFELEGERRPSVRSEYDLRGACAPRAGTAEI